jgi:hypothetical protein
MEPKMSEATTVPTAQTMTVTDELKKAIDAAVNPNDMREILRAELERQIAAAAGPEAAAAVAAADQKIVDAAAAAQAAADAENAKNSSADEPLLQRTEIIGGREFLFEATTEAELDRVILNAYKVAYATQENNAPEVQVDPVAARQAAEKAAADDAAAKVELELRFKRGEISTADYIEQSGALKDYLAKQGVPLDELRATVEQGRDNKTVLSWQQATEQFLNGPAGSDWPGGNQNLKIIGLKIAEMGLVDAEDKVGALAAAYNAMKQEKLVFKNEEIPVAAVTPAAAATTAAAATPATTPAAAAAATSSAAPILQTPRMSSGMFGASSGVGEGVSAPAPKGDVKIDPNATPEEILAAWKAQQIASGVNPNDAFIDTFKGRR